MKSAFKRVLSAFLSILLLLTSVPLSGFVDMKLPHLGIGEKLSSAFSFLEPKANAADENKCGDDLTWTFEDGVLTIAGNGDMWDSQPWSKYNNKITGVVFSGNITSIGARAFAGCSHLETISIPETVEHLGSCFIQGTAISELTVPKSINPNWFPDWVERERYEEFGYGNENDENGYPYFYYYDYDEWGYGNENRLYLYCDEAGNGPFAGCTTLKTVTLEEGLAEIPQYFFASVGYSSYITSVNIPKTVSRIGTRAFYKSDSLSTVTLNYNDEKIATDTEGLKDFSVTIGDEAFSGCKALKTVTLTENVTSIGNKAFIGCANLSALALPESLTHLGSLFIRGTNISKLTIPKNLRSCGNDESNGPLAGCTTLTSVTLQEGLSEIPDCLFASAGYSSYITTVNIPKTVSRIGRRAFYKCASLTSATLNYNSEKVATDTEGLKNFSLTIGDEAFSGCKALKTMKLTENVTSIGYEAFLGCANITSLDLPKSLTYLGAYFIRGTSVSKLSIPKTLDSCGYSGKNGPFAGCTTLKTVTLEEGLEKIPNYLFASGDYSSYITSVNIPKTVKSIGNRAFYYCKSLSKVVLNYNDSKIATATMGLQDFAVTIGAEAFMGCSSLKTVTLTENVTSIGNGAFSGCANLTSLALPQRVTYLGICFIRGTSISKITIPKNVGSSLYDPYYEDDGYDEGDEEPAYEDYYDYPEEYGALSGCTSLKNVTLEEGLATIPDHFFSEAAYITSVNIPKTVGSIGNYAFFNCRSLTKVTLNYNDKKIATETEGLQNFAVTIGSEAFSGCSSLETVTLTENVTSIGDRAFWGCASLASLSLPDRVTHLGYSFISGTSISTITIPKNVKSCGHNDDYDDEWGNVGYYGPLNGCETLTEVIFADGTQQIPAYICSFSGRNKSHITKVTMPSSVREIGDYAFYNCSALEEITLPGVNMTLASHTFYGCDALAKVNAGKNTYEIKDNVATFRGHKYTLEYVEDGISRDDASTLCTAKKGHLMSVENAAEELVIDLLAQTNYADGAIWLFGTDEEKEGTWTYPNGDDFSYTKWAEDQPDNGGGDGRYDEDDNWIKIEENYQSYGGSYFSGYWNDLSGESVCNYYILETDGEIGSDVTLKVLDGSGKDVSKNVTVKWYKQGELIATGAKLMNRLLNNTYTYEVILNEDLAKTHYIPQRQTLTNDADAKSVTFKLTAVPKVKVSGEVKSNTGAAVAGATLTFSQTINDKYKSTVTSKTDKNGKYTAEIYRTSTALTVAADNYYNYTADGIEAFLPDSGSVALAAVELKPLSARRITISLTKSAVDASGTKFETTPVGNIDGLEFSLNNKTQKKNITAFTAQYPYIILEDDSVKAKDVIEISVTDTSGNTKAKTASVTLDANCNGEAALTLEENGRISVGAVTGAEGIFMIFDGKGKYMYTYAAQGNAVSDPLADGRYSVVFIKNTSMLRSVSELSKLGEFGLNEGSDYVLKAVNVKVGSVISVGNIDIPDFNETKLYYTVNGNTNMSANKYDLSQGKIVNLRAEYEVDPKYDAKEQYVLIALPAGMAFIENSLTVDGAITSYEYDKSKNTVKAYANASRSVVRLSAAATDDGSQTAEGYLGFTIEDEAVLQPIGSVKINVEPIAFSVPDKTGRMKIQIGGSGLTSSEVKIYDNGKLTATTQSNKAGSWSATITLSGKKENYSEHAIYAELTSKTLGYTVRSAVKTVTYVSDYVDLSKVTMINTAHDGTTREFVTTVDFLNPTTETLSYNYWPEYPTFTFIVELTTDNPDLVSDVYAVTKNAQGEVTYIPCEFDKASGTWIGKHDFYDSAEKPAQITAAFNVADDDKRSLLVNTLSSSPDIVTDDFVLKRTYSAEIEMFGEIGLFGYGWSTDYDITLSEKIYDGVSYLYLVGVGYYDLLKSDGSGDYTSEYIEGARAEKSNNGSVKYYGSTGVVFGFDPSGRISEIKAGDETVRLTYSDGGLAGIEYSDGTKVAVQSVNGLVRSVTAPDGTKAEYEYSGNYLVKVTADGASVEYGYNMNATDRSKHALKEIEFDNGSHRYIDYDSYGRVVSVYNDNKANLVEYAYTGTDTVTQKTAGKTETYKFDTSGRMSTYSNSEGLGYEVTYTDNDVLDVIKYNDGSEYKFEYDENGVVTSAKITEKGNELTPFKYERDAEENITAIYDGNGNRTGYSWSDGNLSSVTYADGTTERYNYDEDGMLLSYTDRAGNVTSYVYENDALKSVKNEAFGEMVFTIDGKASYTVKDSSGETKVTFDSNRNISSVTYPDGKTISYVFSENGILQSVTDTEGIKTNYVYDKLGRLSQLTDNNGKALVTYEYTSDSLIKKQTNANGTYTEYSYAGGKVTEIKTGDSSKKVISDIKYKYNASGKITSMTDGSGTTSYEYDLIGQLVNVKAPDGTVTSYEYDSAGNRVKETVGKQTTVYKTNNINQYTEIGTKTYEYDKNGALIAEHDGDITRTFTYDAMGRLIREDDGASILEYSYNVFGYRNKVNNNGIVTNYYWSPLGSGQVISSYSSDGTNSSYIYAGKLVAEYVNGEYYYYNFNIQGSATSLTDAKGNVVNQYAYSHSGEVVSRSEEVSNPFTYVGAYGVMDDDSGLYYARARFIDPSTGRFISPEPTGQCYSFNIYCYADNDPVNNIDVSGDVVLTTLLALSAVSAVASVGIDIAWDGLIEKKNVFSGEYWSENWDDLLISGAFGFATGMVGGSGLSAGWKLAGKVGLAGMKSVTKDLVNNWKDDAGNSGWDIFWNAGNEMAFSFLFEKISKGFEGTKIGGKIADWLGKFEHIPHSKCWQLTDYILKSAWPKYVKQLPYELVKTIVKKGIKKGGQWIQGGLLDWLWKTIFGIDDPSGYVYEAVPSNRIEGVTATAYTLNEWKDDSGETKTEEVKWDATEYNQQNPLITNAFGQYAWDVPNGKWRVKYEKQGYTTTYSDWLDVPPPQTDVNIGIVATATPEVKDVALYTDGADITFTQYMKIDSVTASSVTLTVGGKAVKGTIAALNAEASGADATVSYASSFRFVPDGKAALSGKGKVEVSGAVNYAGKAMEDKFTSAELTAKVRPTEITASKSVTAVKGDTFELELAVDAGKDAAGSVIEVVSYSPSIADVTKNEVTVGADGKAKVSLNARLPGNAEISYTIKGTMVTGTTKVLVNLTEAEAHEHVPGEAVQENVTAATCVAAGSYDSVVYCTVCSEELSRETVNTEKASSAHTWDSGKVTKTPTADADGEMTYTCVLCGATRTVAVPKQSGISDRLLGDVDGDGKILAKDARLALRCSASLENLDAAAQKAADVDEDGKVLAKDARQILRFSAQLQSEFEKAKAA